MAQASGAFGALTTNQYQKYFPGATTADNEGIYSNDSALDENGIVLDGDVTSAPQTNGALTSGSFEITGPQPNGFSEARRDPARERTEVRRAAADLHPAERHLDLPAGRPRLA